MFGLGFGEILLLMALGLIVLGPKQMPQVARVIGRTLAELKKALSDVTSAVTIDLKEDEKKTGTAKAPAAAKSDAPPSGAPKKEYVPHKPFVFKDETAPQSDKKKEDT